MGSIIRGTTPTIKFSFRQIDPADIFTAFLVVKQLGAVKIRLPLEAAARDESSLSWMLTQEQTLSLSPGREVTIVCDWKLHNGVRGRSEEAVYSTEEPGVKEVI